MHVFCKILPFASHSHSVEYLFNGNHMNHFLMQPPPTKLI